MLSFSIQCYNKIPHQRVGHALRIICFTTIAKNLQKLPSIFHKIPIIDHIWQNGKVKLEDSINLLQPDLSKNLLSYINNSKNKGY